MLTPYRFTCHIFFKGGNVTIADAYARPYSGEGSLSCHTYFDIGPRLLLSHLKQPLFSRLLRKAKDIEHLF